MKSFRINSLSIKIGKNVFFGICLSASLQQPYCLLSGCELPFKSTKSSFLLEPGIILYLYRRRLLASCEESTSGTNVKTTNLQFVTDYG